MRSEWRKTAYKPGFARITLAIFTYPAIGGFAQSMMRKRGDLHAFSGVLMRDRQFSRRAK
ncbi:MAG: hypothetical protein CMO06_04070 [Thalassospira sp.]|nr:hypothetical protein [Thalassospira sp.]